MDDNHPDSPVDKWFFIEPAGKQPHQANELSFGRVKVYLYESLRRCISRHDLKECFRLLKILPKESSLDPYALFRFILILVESSQSKKLHKTVIIYLESLLSKTNLHGPDSFVEFLAYFIKHNRIDDARELFAQRHRHLTLKSHRSLPYVDVNLRCYEFLFHYLSWEDKISQDYKKNVFDLSIQGWIVNAMDCLKSTQSNHEYFFMRILRVLLYYGYFNKAYLFSSEYQRNNDNNMSAQLIHLKLIDQLTATQDHENQLDQIPMECDTNPDKLEENRVIELENINNFSALLEDEMFKTNHFPVEAERMKVLSNLRRLDCTRKELIGVDVTRDNALTLLKDTLDALEVVSEVKKVQRWLRLKDIIAAIVSSDDRALITGARHLWSTRYSRFWSGIDFLELAGDSISRSDQMSIADVLRQLHDNLDVSNKQ